MTFFPVRLALALGAAIAIQIGAVLAQDATRTLFTNVHVFDGTNEPRIENAAIVTDSAVLPRA